MKSTDSNENISNEKDSECGGMSTMVLKAILKQSETNQATICILDTGASFTNMANRFADESVQQTNR